MKHILLSLAFVMSIGFLNAQLTYGVTGALNLSSYKESASGISITSANRTSFVLGGILNYEIQEGFSIVSGLQVGGMGGSYMGEVFKLNYLQIPLLAKYSLTDKIFLNAGPQLGVLLSAKVGGEDVKSEFTSTDVQLVGGGGFQITDNIGALLRYGFSLSNVAAGSGTGVSSKNRMISLGLAYTF